MHFFFSLSSEKLPEEPYGRYPQEEEQIPVRPLLEVLHDEADVGVSPRLAQRPQDHQRGLVSVGPQRSRRNQSRQRINFRKTCQ